MQQGALVLRRYTQCCPPPRFTDSGKAHGSYPPLVPPGLSRRIAPPSDCRFPGYIPPNPCARHTFSKDSYKKYRILSFYIGLPLILAMMYRMFYVKPYHKHSPCRDYEYMRRRTKRFPWGDGTKSLFHNDKTNFLPGECEAPVIDPCDE